MRKLLFVSLCLDFVWINSAVVLVDRLLPGIAETVLGQPTSWAARQTLSLVLLAVMRGANVSIGEWLLAYARTEQAGRRQWANLLLGALGFASGIWYLLRVTEPNDTTPFLFMVENTPLKIAAMAIFSAFYSWCGVMLLRFAPRAKLQRSAVRLDTSVDRDQRDLFPGCDGRHDGSARRQPGPILPG